MSTYINYFQNKRKLSFWTHWCYIELTGFWSVCTKINYFKRCAYFRSFTLFLLPKYLSTDQQCVKIFNTNLKSLMLLSKSSNDSVNFTDDSSGVNKGYCDSTLFEYLCLCQSEHLYVVLFLTRYLRIARIIVCFASRITD